MSTELLSDLTDGLFEFIVAFVSQYLTGWLLIVFIVFPLQAVKNVLGLNRRKSTSRSGKPTWT
jgi:hypothetical protein